MISLSQHHHITFFVLRPTDLTVTCADHAGATGTCHDIIRATKYVNKVENCARDNTKNGVRCCSDTYITGYKRVSCNGKTLYTASNSAGFDGCRHLTWPQANSLCKSMCARLCTRKEISSQCTAGTGCGHDKDLIWASTSELQSECPALPWHAIVTIIVAF